MSHGGEGGEDDLAAMAWPGFVDVLSSVLIMFVFFLMLTAVALAFHTAMYKSKIKAQFVQETEKKVEAEVKDTAATLIEENQQLKQMLEQAQQMAKTSSEAKVELESKLDVLQQSAILAESKDQTVKIEDGNNFVVFYGPDAISLTPETSAAVAEFLAPHAPADIKVTITATRGTSNMVDEVARRVSVARMLNLRNAVIKANVPSAQITGKVIEGGPVDEKFDWVRMTVEAK